MIASDQTPYLVPHMLREGQGWARARFRFRILGVKVTRLERNYERV